MPHKRKLLHSVKDQKKNDLSREVFNRLQGLLAGELFADWTDRIDSIRRRRPIKTERECADNLLRVTRNGLNSAYREELYAYFTLSAFPLNGKAPNARKRTSHGRLGRGWKSSRWVLANCGSRSVLDLAFSAHAEVTFVSIALPFRLLSLCSES